MPTEILKADQYLTEDWHQLRRNSISASEIAAVMGLSPWATPFSLYWAKKDDWREPETEAMKMGLKLEPIVADLLWDRIANNEQDHHFELAETGTWQADNPTWALATPDRLLRWSNGSEEDVELKTSSTLDGWGPDESDEVPVYYRCQVLWQLFVLGLNRAHIGVLFRGNHFRHYIIDRDDNDIRTMVQAAERFMLRLTTQTPPPVDGSEATLDTLKRLHPTLSDHDAMLPAELVREWQEAVSDLKQAKARKALVENSVRLAIGDAARAVDPDGNTVLLRQVFDVPEYTVRASTRDQLRSAS